MRARVTGMVWIPKREADPKLIKHLRSVLTIQPKKLGNYGDDAPRDPIYCYAENAVEFGVPRAYWFANAKGSYDYDWSLSTGSPIDLDTTLRHTGTFSEQQSCIDRFMDRFDLLNSPDAGITDSEIGLSLGGIFQAGTGFGKTNTALGLIRKLGVTTLVLVHKEFLQRQWVQRIEKFLPNAKVGIVREKKCDFEGKDIVVAMMQSIALTAEDHERYPAALYDWPGLLVVDETHRVGAPTWSPIPTMFPAAWRLGLTATPRRKDGADSVFWWHIGEILYKAEKVMPKPYVRVVEVEKDRENTPDIVKRPGISPAVVTNVLVKLKKRNKRVVREIMLALKAPTGRKIMVLSERLEHLRSLERSVSILSDREDLGITTGFYVGEWFTGDSTPVLKPKAWVMDEEGRKAAILTLYRTLSRRRLKDTKGNKLPSGAILVDKNTKEKSHMVSLTGATVNAIQGLTGSGSFDDNLMVPLILQTLDDAEIFQLAREFKIAQKPNEKKKTLTEAELFETEKARVIFATYQMCSEGVDLPAVDTLILASPIGDVEQAAGRARRECVPVAHGGEKTPEDCAHFCEWRKNTCTGKPNPIVADIVDLGISMATKRAAYRDTYYRKSKFVVASGS